MIIGLCGAQGAGKTTLAQEYCQRNKHFSFATTSVSGIMKANGMDPSVDYPMEKRLWMQNILLTELDAFYAKFGENAIFDRTPLDMAAYLLADVQRTNVTREQQDAIAAYVTRCFDITNRRFTVIVGVPAVLPEQPGRDGKAPSDPGYVEHIQTLISGLRCDERMRAKQFVLPRGYLDLEKRAKAVESAVGRVTRTYLVEVENQFLSGTYSH